MLVTPVNKKQCSFERFRHFSRGGRGGKNNNVSVKRCVGNKNKRYQFLPLATVSDDVSVLTCRVVSSVCTYLGMLRIFERRWAFLYSCVG